MSSDEEDLDVIHEAEAEVEQVERDEDDVNEGVNPEPSKNREVIKPRRVRNPQPKLNAETLKGPRGLMAMPELFMKQKFKGKGHEEQDLRVLLKTYEYWCHRLFPKYTFGECVERLEKLGTKKPVITYIKKIRMGLEDIDEPQQKVVSSDEEENHEPQSNQDTEFDLLVQEAGPSQAPQLTKEQLETIRINKEKALKLRQERLRRIQEQVQQKLTVSEKLPTQKERRSSDDNKGGRSENEKSEDEKMREVEDKKDEDVKSEESEDDKDEESEDDKGESSEDDKGETSEDDKSEESEVENVTFNRKRIEAKNEENTFRKIKKRIVSDSEESESEKEEDKSEDVKMKVRKVLLDSDESEDENKRSLNDEDDGEEEEISPRKVKKRILLDSESDEDKENVESNLEKASPDKKENLVDEDSYKENEEMEVTEN